MLPLLKMLQLSDLYSKNSDAVLNNDKLKNKYQKPRKNTFFDKILIGELILIYL